MTTTPKIFGQSKPVAGIETNLLTVSGGTTAQLNMFVANQGSTIDTFSIQLIPNGLSPDLARYIAFNTPLIGNGVFSVSGISLSQGDQVQVTTGNGNCSITATGLEFTV